MARVMTVRSNTSPSTSRVMVRRYVSCCRQT
uniref:Uncharacterized protein n=1 Tax=Anguilla anguilla TaxID=7936 RepID=A0A0E9VY61_ANGAN